VTRTVSGARRSSCGERGGQLIPTMSVEWLRWTGTVAFFSSKQLQHRVSPGPFFIPQDTLHSLDSCQENEQNQNGRAGTGTLERPALGMPVTRLCSSTPRSGRNTPCFYERCCAQVRGAGGSLISITLVAGIIHSLMSHTLPSKAACTHLLLGKKRSLYPACAARICSLLHPSEQSLLAFNLLL
jgi:hypothetical protein